MVPGSGVCTIAPLPFEDDHFAVVVALQVLEHLVDPGKSLRNLLWVAPVVVFSIPWKWEKGEAGQVGLDKHTLASWLRTARAEVVSQELLGKVGDHARLLVTVRKG